MTAICEAAQVAGAPLGGCGDLDGSRADAMASKDTAPLGHAATASSSSPLGVLALDADALPSVGDAGWLEVVGVVPGSQARYADRVRSRGQIDR